jgi:hypothetical protein
MEKWSENEIKFLIDNYSKSGLTYCSSVLDRTKESIIGKKKQLKLHSNVQKNWSDNEIDYLNNNYSEYGTKYCVNYLNRSWSSVVGMAAKLKLKAKKRNALNKTEKNFLRINYPIYGSEYCMNKLNRSKAIIQSNTHDMELKTNEGVKGVNIINKRKKINYLKYNISKIITIENKYAAYLLGYFWADGHVRKDHAYLTTINLVKNDAEFLYNIVTNISDGWTIGKEIKKYWTNNVGEIIRAQNQRTIRSYSQELFYFLEKNDYLIKSNVNFNKIWLKIPENLKSFFILGYYDGDGHFNYQFRHNKYHSGEFVITSSYNYDWSTLEQFYKENKIEYSIYRTFEKLGRVSRIIVRKRDSLIKLYALLYNDEFKGLERKYSKFLKYINTCR